MWWWIGPPRVVNDGRTHERERERRGEEAKNLRHWKLSRNLLLFESSSFISFTVVYTTSWNMALAYERWCAALEPRGRESCKMRSGRRGDGNETQQNKKKSHQRRHFNVGMFCIHLLSTLLVSSHFTSLHIPCPARERRRRGGKWTWTMTKKDDDGWQCVWYQEFN